MTLREKLQRQKSWHDMTITLSVAVLIVCSSLMLKDHLFASFETFLAPNQIHEVSYKISAGDTLWLLASKTVQSNEDIRDKIIAIRDLNGMTPTQPLMPGQIVRIPMKRFEDSGMRYTFYDAH